MKRLFGEAADFLRLAVPMVISRAGLAGMGIADGIMVARHSSAQLALLGFSEGTLGRVLDVLVALLIGGIALAARANESAAPHEAGAVWRRAVRLALVAGVAAAALGLAGRWWIGWFGEAPSLAEGAAPVVAVLGAGMPLALVAVATAVFLEAVGRAPVVAATVVAANALNVALNWLLIGGQFGFPALGALGSAISTGIVRAVLALGLVIYAWTLADHARLGIRRAPPGVARGNAVERRRRGDGAQQRRLGYGAAVTAAVMNLLGMAVTVLAGWLGMPPLAAITALWNALSVGALLAYGMADATALRVAAAVGGAPKGGHARRTPLGSALLGLGVTMLALALLVMPVLLAPGAVAAIYAAHWQLRAALIALLPLGGLVLLSDGASFVCGGALRGLGDAAWPAGLQIAVAVLLVPLAWWLAVGRGGGAAGLIAAILITSVLRAVLLGARVAWCAGRTELAPAGSLAMRVP
jgi:multidrug resistance protein, MATE family